MVVAEINIGSKAEYVCHAIRDISSRSHARAGSVPAITPTGVRADHLVMPPATDLDVRPATGKGVDGWLT